MAEFPILGGGGQNVFGNALEAFNMGRQLARQRGVDDALAQASTDPDTAKKQLTKYGAFDELKALEEQAKKANAMRLGKVAATNPQAAADEALGLGEFDLAKTFAGLDQTKQAQAQKNLGLAASVGAKLLESIPVDPANPQASLAARKAKLQELLPAINQALGHDELDIETLDLTDAGIQNLLASAQSIGAYTPPGVKTVSRGRGGYDVIRDDQTGALVRSVEPEDKYEDPLDRQYREAQIIKARRAPVGRARASGGGLAVAVSSAEQYNSLPPGTQYTAPDGTVRTKR